MSALTNHFCKTHTFPVLATAQDCRYVPNETVASRGVRNLGRPSFVLAMIGNNQSVSQLASIAIGVFAVALFVGNRAIL